MKQTLQLHQWSSQLELDVVALFSLLIVQNTSATEEQNIISSQLGTAQVYCTEQVKMRS